MGKNKGKGKGKKGKGGGTYLSPGVYIEEVPSGARPLEGVGTSVAAFVGTGGEAPPAPRRTHRLRRVVVLAVLVAGAAFAVQAWRRAQP
jgi:phage tail sheath protein FI